MLSDLDMFSDDQAVTGSAASTNYVDVGEYAGKGEPVEIEVRVTTSFATLTSLHVSIQQCDTTGGSYTDVVSGPEIVLASLVAGYKFKLNFLPDVHQRYVKLHYAVTGDDATAGKIAAYIVAPGGVDEGYEDGLYFDARNTTGAASTA